MNNVFIIRKAILPLFLGLTLAACSSEDTSSTSSTANSNNADSTQEAAQADNSSGNDNVLVKTPENDTPTDEVGSDVSEEQTTSDPATEETATDSTEPTDTTESGEETTPSSEEQTSGPQETTDEPEKSNVRVDTAIHQDFSYSNSQLQDLALIGSGNAGILFTSVANTADDSAKIYSASTYSKSSSVDFTQWASLSTTDDRSDVTPFAIGDGRFYAYCQENNGTTEFVVRELGNTDALLTQPLPNKTVDSQTYQIDQCRGLSDITTEARSDGSTTVRLFVATQQVNVNSATDIRSEIMQMLFVMSQDESNSTWSAGSAAWDSAKNSDRDPVAAWEADRDRILDIELEQTSDNQYMLYVAKRHYAYGGVMSNRVFAYRYYAATNRSSDLGFRIFNNPWGNAAANWQVTDMEAIDGTLYVTSQSDGIAYANFVNSSQDTTNPTSMTVPTVGQVCSGGIAWNGVAVADGNDARFYCGSAQDKKNVISVLVADLVSSSSTSGSSEDTSSTDSGSGEVLAQNDGE